ncbi:glycosyl transferase [Sulfurovum sp. AR]|uniref:glycosyl transferase n=1 Tax=Sulfurovum sp. AR TaxID=1165841 RepID=UPI00025C4C11|nr:glycosyl transferase [Sulfurovum sp. AR]EIF51319.1 putative glycosyltransferase [Sulfurovum sp. AR]
MADFFQNGLITTLQNLSNRTLEEMEAELEKFSQRHNMVLLLPALYSEFETPAMKQILKELKGVKYLYKIILGLDRATKEEFENVKTIMATLDVRVDVLWNDGPNVQKLYHEFNDLGFNSIKIKGKGRNVWTMLGYALADKNAFAFALHDCDIVNYSREVPARLFYPIIHPALDFEFNKGYYSRVTDKLHGRVTRLFYTPLIKALKNTYGESAYLNYMDSFRYALSGEFAFTRTLARGIRISPTWGLEVSTLSEVYDKTSVRRICQTEIMESYEHKHQELRGENPAQELEGGVAKMAIDIAQTIFRVMTQSGVTFSKESLTTLRSSFFHESRKAISRYDAVAKFNALNFDRKKEIDAVETFDTALKEACESFLADPLGVPSLSAWTSIRSVCPEISERFKATVNKDNASC